MSMYLTYQTARHIDAYDADAREGDAKRYTEAYCAEIARHHRTIARSCGGFTRDTTSWPVASGPWYARRA